MTKVPGVEPGWDTGPTDHGPDDLDTGAGVTAAAVTGPASSCLSMSSSCQEKIISDSIGR